MGRAIGYARVSTDSQADSGASLEVQQRKIRAAAELQDLELERVIVDAGASAKDLRRPGAAELLELVEAGELDAVIVYKLDRLTRSVKDLGELLELFERCGVALVSVSESLDTSSAAGRLVLNVMGAVSQWEREAISERTREALQQKRANGQRIGNVPFGFRVIDGTKDLEPNPAEQKILRTAKRLRSSGYTLQGVADRLNAKGYTTRTGRSWKVRNAHHLLQVTG